MPSTIARRCQRRIMNCSSLWRRFGASQLRERGAEKRARAAAAAITTRHRRRKVMAMRRGRRSVLSRGRARKGGEGEGVPGGGGRSRILPMRLSAQKKPRHERTWAARRKVRLARRGERWMVRCSLCSFGAFRCLCSLAQLAQPDHSYLIYAKLVPTLLSTLHTNTK